MKKFIAYLTIFGLVFSRCAFAEETCAEEACAVCPAEAEILYSDEDDEYFNRGKFVGNESDEFLRARQRVRNRNWAVAIGTTAVGIATLILVGKNHH